MSKCYCIECQPYEPEQPDAMYSYIQVMEQVDNPSGVKSQLPVKCTSKQAKALIGQLYSGNKSWRIVDMVMQDFFA